MKLDPHRVSALIREVAEAEILPRFQNLRDDEVLEKNKGDIVTAADLATEKALSLKLQEIFPGSLVVGEEGVHADPNLMDHLKSEEFVWIIDPVDGTRSYARGETGFCVIVALTRHGETLAGWIYQPINRTMAFAEKGKGATLNGKPLKTVAATMTTARGALHTSYLPKHLRDQMKDTIKGMASNKPVSSAGIEYVRIASGETDVSMFWNSYPWDHAAGALIVEEAGGKVGFRTGERYHPGDTETKGILATGDVSLWQTWCDALFNEEKWGQWKK